MKKSYDEMDDLERCLQARREIERQFKTPAKLGAFMRKEERKSARNIAMAKRLLAERDAAVAKEASAAHRRKNAKRTA